MFNFFRKLFKALNSSGKAWQLTGAVILAIFAGFLPSNTLILFDILLLALILNVNFGLFLLFSVVFSGIGYLFDPLFESIGYSVLTNEGLNGFFTSLYNSAMFRWSSFNYTLVTGSLLVSAVLSLPMYFILNKFVVIYRVQLGQKLNEWKFTKWMKLFNEEESSSSLFRWWGLGVFGGLAAVIILFMIFLFDPLARIGLEKSLSYTLQSEVNIDDFSSNLSDLDVKVSGVQIADKDQLTHNIVQIGSIGFDLAFGALMEKKVMIEDLKVDALAFGVLRETPAEPYHGTDKVVKEEVGSGSEGDTKASSASTPFTLPNVDDILAKESLKSIEEAQTLRKDIQATQEKWKKISGELNSSDDVDQIKADAIALQKSLKGGDVQKILSAKHDIDKIESKVKKLKTKYANLQKEFNTDKASLNKRISDLKNLPAQDVKRLKEKYSLSASGGANLIGTLVNNEVATYMKKALAYYEMLKPYINDAQESKTVKELEPPRGQGRWIKYANLSNIPEVVIKNADINVIFEDDLLDVNMKDFSSNQKLYKKPMVINADAKGNAYKQIVANIVDDRREDEAKLTFDAKAAGVKTAESNMQTLVMKDMLTDATMKGEIVDGDIKARSLVQVKQASVQMPSQPFINDLLKAIKRFDVNIKVNGPVVKPSIAVNSDLDRQLSQGLKSMASKAGKDFEKELTSGVMKKVSSSNKGITADLGDIDSLLNSKQSTLDGIDLDFKSSSSNPLKGLF
ncbi:TIGR03545 family protein [Campylobacterota bacterium]